MPVARKRPGQAINLEAARQAALDGDSAALERLAVALVPRVRNLVRYLVRGDSEVDDIAQEAMIDFLLGMRSYRGDGSLTAWTDRVTVRATFGYLRRNRRARREVWTESDLMIVESPDGTPDDYAERRRVVALLDNISDDQRHAMVLHYVLGMTVPEVAEMVEVPIETVRSRLRVGMARLRELNGAEE